PYQLTLLLPAFAYAIALLGLNLLFGTTGLLSFGHALFVALGAYTAAWLTTRAGVLALEAIVLAAAALAAVIALPVGLLCVRYVKISFGMLTLAFGMLFYSFLYKFYLVTGGDEGIRVLRPRLLGQTFAGLDKVGFLTGPFYYYALALLVLAALVMRRIVRSPFGLSLRAIRENPDKAAFVGVSVRRYRFYAFMIAAVFEAVDIRMFYGSVCALDGVTLRIGRGEFVSIIGPNGAGKTTLVNVLTGLLAPTSGTVRFKGEDVGGVGPVRLARLGMARAFQLVNVFPALTVGETIAVAVLARLGRGARLFAALAGERGVWDGG